MDHLPHEDQKAIARAVALWKKRMEESPEDVIALVSIDLDERVELMRQVDYMAVHEYCMLALMLGAHLVRERDGESLGALQRRVVDELSDFLNRLSLIDVHDRQYESVRAAAQGARKQVLQFDIE